jgi:hypothetical protein
MVLLAILAVRLYYGISSRSILRRKLVSSVSKWRSPIHSGRVRSSWRMCYAEADSQQIWGTAEADVIREGMTPQAAADEALNRIGVILAKYPIAES